jgi:hypothetical protein
MEANSFVVVWVKVNGNNLVKQACHHWDPRVGEGGTVAWFGKIWEGKWNDGLAQAMLIRHESLKSAFDLCNESVTWFFEVGTEFWNIIEINLALKGMKNWKLC